MSFDALLSQQWFTNGAGIEDPRVGLELWTEDQFLEYSDQHGTVDIVPENGIDPEDPDYAAITALIDAALVPTPEPTPAP